ncbi:MAG TPA: hypothetical protein VFC63_03910 [Blastocatellia bacterium]|nr:hypothetical protein [Blastocatellia bacterium]
MHVVTKSICRPKAGNTIAEYEDACWPTERVELDTDEFRCAVADGATESSFADIWARLLTVSYVHGRLRVSSVIEDLMPLQESMVKQMSLEKLPWYAAEKGEKGAFSTLLGLTITEDKSKDLIGWSSMATGDSCLFHLRGEDLIVAFPLNSAEQFCNRPFLLASNPRFNGGLTEAIDCADGLAKSGDEFMLMTDALAHWFLHSAAKLESPWRILRDFVDSEDDEAFDAWIGRMRHDSLMRNDDVTFLHIEID